jgi:hypothetical protein
MKNPVFVDFNVYDILGTLLEPGDIIAYSSNSREQPMRIGVFAGTMINKKEKKQILIYLMHEDGFMPLPIVVRPIFWAGNPEDHFTLERVIVLSPEYHINSSLIIQAMKQVEKMTDEGMIK